MSNHITTTNPPGPKGLPVLGNTLQFGRHTFNFLQQCRKEYGDVVYFEVLGQPFYQLNDPEDIHHVLVENNTNYTKGSFLTKQFGEFLGKGLLLNEGDDWRRQRHLVQPAFDPERISIYAEMMTDYTERLLAGWEAGTPRDIHTDMTRLTLEVAASTLLDIDIREESSELRSAFHDIMEEFRKRTARPVSLPQWVPTPRNRRYQHALEQINEIVYDIIARRRAEPGNGVVSMLLEASDEPDTTVNDKQLRDEIVTLLFAGHETTAIALTFTWYLLATHPRQEERLVAELDDVLDGEPPTMSAVPDLEYTRKVLKESLRLYPPVFGILREPVRDDQIGGYQIPSGATVAMNQIAVHHDPRFFDDPKAFTPERWSDAFEESLPQFAYFPFGGGPRRCIGERFAMLEATLVVATIAQQYHLELVSDRDLTLKPSVTTRPDKPIRVRPELR
ncbi:cytochrome P450 [Halorubrum sp. HHNYT27]|uniref:cytochrome P450 n=1 Tax=Halorubrum sp. HHNYT27 TaxID=3402275 RepID=UPI003EBF6315